MNAPLPLSSVAALSGDTHFPVVIVGAGPTGLMLANLLGIQGIKTLVIERNTSTVGEPRAVTIDDESLRTVQATGLIGEVLPHVVQGYGVHYYSWRGKEFARIEPNVMEHGFPKRNAFRQQVLVGQLRDGLQRFDDAAIWFGHELLRFEDDGEAVHLALQHAGETKAISCSWLVACDGGRSSVREQLGIKLTGSTYDEKWLIVDLLDRGSAFRHTRTYCDPARPAIRLPGPDGTLRYEFMLHEGEDPEQMLDETRVRSWIHAREPADATLAITRKVVYAFHARVAERWKSGRVFLAGDAAHLTPPFAGQGMNSGVRDAANLAWKLAAVVQGRLSASVLESYEVERKPHAWSLIQMAVRIGTFMQPKSALVAMLTQGALKLCSVYRPVRDYVMQLKFKPKPRFLQGFLLQVKKLRRWCLQGNCCPNRWWSCRAVRAWPWTTYWATALRCWRWLMLIQAPHSKVWRHQVWLADMYRWSCRQMISSRPLARNRHPMRCCATAMARLKKSFAAPAPMPCCCGQTAMCWLTSTATTRTAALGCGSCSSSFQARPPLSVLISVPASSQMRHRPYPFINLRRQTMTRTAPAFIIKPALTLTSAVLALLTAVAATRRPRAGLSHQTRPRRHALPGG
ncbi:bifunctional 3-(3-hydroxy-phenyl)propionate/3-hydroxycinnamic acid hydroxylase [Polaromonas sp. P1-6]|nr:bifunctional 3-(3-hydroxy-phenyl)propionate/3-hydroxycinnamic acid hydroxylase [Polaromonas sp. P1-6]